jgi:hypothetical protein
MLLRLRLQLMIIDVMSAGAAAAATAAVPAARCVGNSPPAPTHVHAIILYSHPTLPCSAPHLLHSAAVAARGLDVKDLVLVLNYDVPNHHEDYVHR